MSCLPNRKSVLLLVLLAISAQISNVVAATIDEVEVIRQRLEKLENRNEETEGFRLAGDSKSLTISGILEVEASYSDTSDSEAVSDITVTTALLTLEAAISDEVKGFIALIHEEDEDPSLDIDEAYITVGRTEIMGGEMQFIAGKAYLPFGAFNSAMVTDPLTLSLGEINRTTILTDLQNDKVSVRLGIYNGDVDTTVDDIIDNGVIALSMTPTENISFGASFICDLAETDLCLLGDATSDYEENVSAWSAYLTLDLSPLSLNLEYLGAINKFSAAMLADQNRSAELTGRKPSACFAEASYSPSEVWQFSGRYEKASDFQDDVLRYGVTISYGLDDDTALSLEYLCSDFDRPTEEVAQQLTLQLAMEF